MIRADFCSKAKEIIAARSGYRCSFPDCDRATIGPGAATRETANTGVAAHIFSASPGGPRGTGGLTKAELRGPENGVWLCANHARLVDSNRGYKYPPELLLSYKALHEARIAREVQGISSPYGWFHEIRIENSPIFKSHLVVRLAKLTLIVGNNSTGKSALCEWLAAFSDLRHVKRWRKGHRKGFPINVFLKYYNPEEKTLEMIIEETGHVKYSDNGRAIPFNANPMKILYPRARSFHSTRDFNDLELIAFLLDADESIVINLCDEVQRYEHSTVKNIVFKKDEDGEMRLHADVSGSAPGLPFHALSGREQERVFIELATAAARIYAKHMPTLLIIDSSVTIFFETWFEFYARHFSDPNSLFQTIVVIPTRKLDVDKLKWLGWEIVRTKGSLPEIAIEQSIRTING
jgi:hypothetical protein